MGLNKEDGKRADDTARLAVILQHFLNLNKEDGKRIEETFERGSNNFTQEELEDLIKNKKDKVEKLGKARGLQANATLLN